MPENLRKRKQKGANEGAWTKRRGKSARNDFPKKKEWEKHRTSLSTSRGGRQGRRERGKQDKACSGGRENVASEFPFLFRKKEGRGAMLAPHKHSRAQGFFWAEESGKFHENANPRYDEQESAKTGGRKKKGTIAKKKNQMEGEKKISGPACGSPFCWVRQFSRLRIEGGLKKKPPNSLTDLPKRKGGAFRGSEKETELPQSVRAIARENSRLYLGEGGEVEKDVEGRPVRSTKFRFRPSTKEGPRKSIRVGWRRGGQRRRGG